ncbi:MAG TPA: retropepsin-like aspartic protease [Chitinophagales bacterium]|nr:retropepsin-like aspartic protease [Chitinophagales bacterium]
MIEIAQIPLILEEIPPKGIHIFIHGKIQRKTVRFLLDTGASKSVIDQDFANRMFPSARRIETEHLTTGLGANIPNAVFLKLRGIKAGKYHLKPITFAVLDLSVVNQAYISAKLEPVVAILGGDILNKYRAVIDYRQRLLQLLVED